MIEYIKGSLTELQPTYAVIEAAGVGYGLNIALPVYTSLVDKHETKLYVEEIIREDAHLLFGFLTKGERELFRMLNSVSGIGANTARVIMSSYGAGEVRQIIATGNVHALSSVKGIGAKTAQRIVVDLKDKILKIELGEGAADDMPMNMVEIGTVETETKQEAVSALTALGFAATASVKVVDKILKDNPNVKVEQLIRQALKML